MKKLRPHQQTTLSTHHSLHNNLLAKLKVTEIGSILIMLALAWGVMNTFSTNSTTYSERISQGSDDSKDDDISQDGVELGKDLWAGLRFQNVTIPAGAKITSAYLELRAYESKSDPTPILQIYAHDTANPSTFASGSTSVSGRTRTSNAVKWTLSSWTKNRTYTSPDLSPIIQELIDDYGEYNSGNIALLLRPTGSELRKAKTYENAPGQAPRLVITFDDAMPVTWASFEAKATGDHGQLLWSTLSELNCDYYEIERSEDGNSFLSIGLVPGSGTTTQESSYSFFDTKLGRVQSSRVYYRLKQVDLDGRFEYSKTVELGLPSSLNGGLSLYPNPVSKGEALQIDYATVEAEETEVSVFDVSGKLISRKMLQGAVSRTAHLPTDRLNPGTYLVQISQGGKPLSQKFVVN